MSQALYRKWRPARFNQVVGQEHVTHTLQNAVAAGRIGHAYLFSGPRGTGKTTLARLLAKAANCLHEDLTERPCNVCGPCVGVNEGRFLDLIEIDAASNTGVDDIRDLRDKINFSPGEGRFRVYIIDEVHMLSTAAFNALLKTLEEPPAHAMFVLATTEEHKVPLTIKSRCQQFNFRLLTTQEISGRLLWMSEQEQLTIEPEAVTMIAQHATGSLRDAESLLDQLVAAPGDAITLIRAQTILGTASNEAVGALTDALLKNNAPAGLRIIHGALASGTDARQFARQMVSYLRQLLLIKTARGELTLDITDEQQAQMNIQVERASREQLIDAVKRFNEAATTATGSWQPQLPLELAFLELLPELEGLPATREGAISYHVAAEPERRIEKTPLAQPEPEETSARPVAKEPVLQGAAGKESQDPMAGALLSIEEVKGVWPQLLSLAAKRDRNLKALLASCKPLGTEGNTLILGFDFPLLRDKFDKKPGAKDAVADVLSQLLEKEILVRIVVTDQYTPPVPPTTVDKGEFAALAEELGGIVQEN